MTATRPRALPVILENINERLLPHRHFCVWKFESRDGEMTKVPYNPRTGYRASSTDPTTWIAFGEARAAYEAGGWDGIGFFFGNGVPLVGVDLDKCRDPESGRIYPNAQRYLSQLDSLAEVSPSETGVKAIVEGALPPGRRVKNGMDWGDGFVGKLEMYDSGRFFALTGHLLPGAPISVTLQTDALTALHAELFPPEPERQPAAGVGHHIGSTFSDQQVIERAGNAGNGAKFQRLYAGNISDYGDDHSAADLALCNILRYWTRGDVVQIDRIFRTSGLMRPKWDKPARTGETYGEGTIARALIGDIYEPRTETPTISANGNGHHHEPVPPASEPPRVDTGKPTRPARYARTDTGNAERFAARYRGQVLFNWQREVWHRWSGTHWQEDVTGAVEQLAKATVRAIPAEADGLEGDKYVEMLKWAASSESDGKRQAMVRLARSEEGIPVLQRALDRDPWLLNCQNGTLDLRTGRLRAHDPNDLITRIVNVDYTPAATCPTFLTFLSRIFDGDAQLIGYVQRLVGYSLTGSIREQIIAICYGTGANGKSTFLRVFRTLLGDYAREANADSFMEQRGESIREDIADLDGARFVAASETADGRRLSEALVKKMTGGERLRARRLYENGWEFDPQFKVWLSTNHRPEIRGTEHAIWRRIRLIPFTVTIPDAEQDKDLAEKLEAELPGILAWAVAGCADWQRAGLQDPPAVTNATAGYRRDMDLLADWVDTRCELHHTYKESAKALYADYVAYCEGNGDEPIKQRTFGVRLTDRGCGEAKGTAGVRLRTGIRLRGDGTKPTQAELGSGASGTSGTKNGKPYIETHSRDLQELNATNATNATNTAPECFACGRDLITDEDQSLGMHTTCWEADDDVPF